MVKVIFLVVTLGSTCLSLKTQSLLEVINTNQNENGICFINDTTVCFNRNEVIHFTYLQGNNQWSESQIAPFSGSYSDLLPFYDPDTDRLYFGSKRPINAGDVENKYNDLWYVAYENGSWAKPVHMGDVFSASGIDSGPCVFNNTMYFHSDRSGKGMYDVDVYQVNLDKPNQIQKMSISTKTVDGEVYISPNGKLLLFMSSGYDSKGYSDIFYCIKEGSDWSEPRSIDTEDIVNTVGWDYAPRLSPDLKTLYLTRYLEIDSDIVSFPLNTLNSYSDLRNALE